jgi:hypothetical protein
MYEVLSSLGKEEIKEVLSSSGKKEILREKI